jgi:RNA polymerase sigma-70 factor (ECF subfamily)
MTYPNPEPAPWRSEPVPDATVAFEVMVSAHYGKLCAFAFRLLGSRELAEDTVHEVLLRIWRNRDRFEFRDPLAYLYRAVRNQIISERRRSGTRSRLLQEQVVSGDMPTRAPDVAAAVEGDELARAAALAVESLPARCRLVYTMRREQGLSYAEIADVLDITTKTVENHMTRAAKLLRARLACYLSLALVVTSATAAAWHGWIFDMI